MFQPRLFSYFALCGGVALLLTLSRISAQGTPPAVTGARAQTPAQPASAQKAAGYVGEDTCLGCHDGMQKGYRNTTHGRAAHPRSPAANHGCESCHGPGQKHVEDPTVAASIIRFDEVQPRVVSEQCLACHTRDSHALWNGSAHDVRNLSCATCHGVHGFRSSRAQLKTADEAETCAQCHRMQVQKSRRFGHMPLREGQMTCSSCHNPHGSTNERMLRVGNWINESCVSCHTDKRGPFLFEHAAGRENCVTCHDPHGSNHDRMLQAKLPLLCQRCHIGTQHPSQIYDMAAVRNRSNRVVNRGCVNCHQNIHGSNHPAGHSFLR